MRLTSFRVETFRNIIDSGHTTVDPGVTCLVGKNEAGKSAMLEALYLANPAYEDDFDVEDQYPRWLKVQDRREGDITKRCPITMELELDAVDLASVEDVLGPGVLTSDLVSVARRYNGGTVWTIQHDETAAVKSMVAAMPPTVSPHLSNITELDALRTGLDALQPVDGDDGGDTRSQGPSQEDLAAAKAVIGDRGLEKTSVWQRIVNILKKRLPLFFRFTAYQTLPGRIDFQELAQDTQDGPGTSGLQTARALLALAGTDTAQLGDENYELRRGELEAVQIDLTNQVFEYWRQNPHLEVLIDVDKETVPAPEGGRQAVARYLDIRLRDKRTGYSNNFQQRSSGFQWFFSFLAAFSEFEGHDRPLIVLLDEPALTLHGKAQGDFLRFINERLASTAPVLYTTHSPFMVETDRLDRVRLVEDHGPAQGATTSQDVLASDPDSLFPLQAALGYDIAQGLFVGPHNLVVEGASDFIYLTTMSQILTERGLGGLDARWRVLPAGGASNIPTFVALIGPHLDVTVLADSDTRGMQRIASLTQRGLLDGKRLILASDAAGANDADIEDLFTEGDYLSLYNGAFGTELKVKDLPAGGRLTKRLERHVGAFDHGNPAEHLLRNHHRITYTETTLARFARLIELINATIQS
jgi:predicted ATPase